MGAPVAARRGSPWLGGVPVIGMHVFDAFLGGESHLTQVVGLVQLACTVWMMVDAYHRGADMYWYWIIFLFQPVGPWVYLVAVKLRTLRRPRLRTARTGQRKLPLAHLQYLVQRAPTVANRLELAQRLMERGAHADAGPLLEAVLSVEPEYGTALHALAECRLATDRPDEAVAPLEKLLRRDPGWSDYRAWRTLLEVHRARGRPADALATCREYTRRSPTLENRCRLAEHLLENGNPKEAVQLLDDALSEYRFAPWNARWRNWRHARTAGQLLMEAEQAEQRAAAAKAQDGNPGTTSATGPIDPGDSAPRPPSA